MSLIVNLHRKDTPNRGDVVSAPGLYGDWGDNEVRIADILGWKRRTGAELDRWHELVKNADLVVVGGGGLLEFDKYRESLELVQALSAKKVIWGAGSNGPPETSWKSLRPTFTGEYGGFDLIGIRDAGQRYEWIPCASCLSPVFDRHYEIETEFAFFANLASPEMADYLPEGVEAEHIISNRKTPLSEIVARMGRAETIVTTSYHGAYWGILLGRKTIAIPTSCKFYGLAHPVPLADKSDWRRFLPLARTYPDALQECRAKSLDFKERVLSLLG